MPSTTNVRGEPVTINGLTCYLRYSMLSLEKIEQQFGSISAMRDQLTDDKGRVRLDRPVIGPLIDVLHAGLLDNYPDTPAERTRLAGELDPTELQNLTEAMGKAFTESFGDLPVNPPEALNRAERRSPGRNGTTSQRSSSGAGKKSGKR